MSDKLDKILNKIKTAADYWGKKASGMIFVCLEDNTILLLKRSDEVHMGGTWGVAGGAIKDLGDRYFDSEDEDDEDSNEPEEDLYVKSAMEEVFEELGSLPITQNKIGETTFVDGNFTYKTFIYSISKKEKERWTPSIRLNWENDEYEWFPVSNLPSNMHPGLAFTLKQLSAEKNVIFKPNSNLEDDEAKRKADRIAKIKAIQQSRKTKAADLGKDLIWNIKIALNGVESIKDMVREIITETASFFQSGQMEAGIKLLATIYEPAILLQQKGLLTEEFVSFIEEDDMTSWVQDIANEVKKEFSTYDESVLEFVIKEVILMVENNLLFTDEVSEFLTVEE